MPRSPIREAEPQPGVSRLLRLPEIVTSRVRSFPHSVLFGVASTVTVAVTNKVPAPGSTVPLAVVATWMVHPRTLTTWLQV